MSKATKMQDKEKKQIIAYYQTGHTMPECAKKFNRSIGSIKNVIDEGKEGKHGDYLKRVETIKKRNAEDILQTLYDDKTTEILTKYRDIITDEDNLVAQIQGDAKLQFFTNTIGMIYDKILKMQQLDSNVHRVDLEIRHDNGFKEALIKKANNINLDNMVNK